MPDDREELIGFNMAELELIFRAVENLREDEIEADPEEVERMEDVLLKIQSALRGNN